VASMGRGWRRLERLHVATPVIVAGQLPDLILGDANASSRPAGSVLRRTGLGR
jgi:hypothetical protein